MTDGTLTNYSTGDDAVALVQLDRPESRNAINTQMLDELVAHLAAARDDESVRALVVSSTDHMGLSGGADVREQLDESGRVKRMELFSQSTTS
jgi:enoyl-CoA hydratase